MKKLLILIVLAAMMLTACQSTTLPTNTDNEHLEATTTEPTAETQKQAPETTAAEEPATKLTEGLLRKFCVSEFRQNQEFHVINVHNDGLFPLATTLPIERDGMRAARGVNAVALYRES